MSVRVLVVEDDTEVAAVTAELLRDIGYQPIEAHDGYGALALLERDPAIEFVLSTAPIIVDIGPGNPAACHED